jgi:hypothetical protein
MITLAAKKEEERGYLSGAGLSRLKRRRAIAFALLCSIVCIVSLTYAGPAAATDDAVLEPSGIRYPEGYDINTVGQIQGTVSGFDQPADGPVRFSLRSTRENYTVIVSPYWFWSDFNVDIADGEEVSVIGSKSLGKDGNLYIIAREIRITATGKTLALRNENGRPLWRRGGRGPGGGYAGTGSTAGGRGRSGPGRGGAGRGRK